MQWSNQVDGNTAPWRGTRNRPPPKPDPRGRAIHYSFGSSRLKADKHFAWRTIFYTVKTFVCSPGFKGGFCLLQFGYCQTWTSLTVLQFPWATYSNYNGTDLLVVQRLWHIFADCLHKRQWIKKSEREADARHIWLTQVLFCPLILLVV